MAGLNSFLTDAEEATGTASAPDSWEGLDAATFEVDGEEIEIVIMSVSQSGGLRLAKRERPYRAGVKLDDTDRKERTYRIEVLFHNDVTEDTQGEEMWPDRANSFEEALEQSGKVGTLNLPWRRNIRCRCESYERKAGTDQYRGGEIFSVTLTEDNEENLSDSVYDVSVTAGLGSAMETLQFSAEAAGIWDGKIADIVEAAAWLQSLINAPGEYLETILTAARALERACINTKKALTTQLEGSNQGSDPAGCSLMDGLTELQDMAGRVGGEAAAKFPATRTRKWNRVRSIYDIATELGQSARDLIAVNSGLEDPTYIEPNTPVQVFA